MTPDCSNPYFIHKKYQLRYGAKSGQKRGEIFVMTVLLVFIDDTEGRPAKIPESVRNEFLKEME